MVLQFNFNNYLQNPIAQFCLDQNKQNLQQSVTLLTLEDCLPDIKKLKHSRESLERKNWSFIGDQLRLYYSLQYDNFLYLDSDVFIPDFEPIFKNKNCTEITSSDSYGKIINNGSFFYSDSNCRFNKFYFDILENEDIPEWMANYMLFKKYPFEYSDKKSGDMNLISPQLKHFLLSSFYFFKRTHKEINIINYTFGDIPEDFSGVIWKLKDCPNYISSTMTKTKDIWYFPLDDSFLKSYDMLSLFKAQLCYIYDKTLKFNEV